MKYLLLPFMWLYGALTWLRNRFYDWHLLPRYRSGLKTIVIGNLQVGGSGKTPMTSYLYRMLSSDYRIAVLSRGYGRKSRGLIEAGKKSDAKQIGDEAQWYHRVLKVPKVVVSEKRKNGLKYLEQGNTELVLLDDAFQHRSVLGNIYIMLTHFAKPYYTDYPLPFGRLREYRTEDRRADIIVVTKCPPDLSLPAKIDMIRMINPEPHQQVFFTCIRQGMPYPLKGTKAFDSNAFSSCAALSAIAYPETFHALCSKYYDTVMKLTYPDHYAYSELDIKEIVAKAGAGRIVFCTEKDAVKLKSEVLMKYIPEDMFYVIPIEPQFMFNEGDKFKNLIMQKLHAGNENK